MEGGESSEGGYIQGAADDAEAWAHGLTAPIFWENKDELLRMAEEALPERIAELVRENGGTGVGRLTRVNPTERVFLGTVEGVEGMVGKEDMVIVVGPKTNAAVAEERKGVYLYLECAAGKVGSRQLRHELPKLLAFLRERLQKLEEGEGRILVACETGRDHSVGAALAILCLIVNDDGGLKQMSEVGDVPSGLNKQIIKQRLSWISVSQPDANPSRTTLQSVNAFLLG